MRKGDKLWYVYIYLPEYEGDVLGPFTSKPVAERHTRIYLYERMVNVPLKELMYDGDVCFATTEIVE